MQASSAFDPRWPLHQPHYDFVQYGGLLRPVELHELRSPVRIVHVPEGRSTQTRSCQVS